MPQMKPSDYTSRKGFQPVVSQERLMQLVKYDPETGIFRHTKRDGTRDGSIAGSRTKAGAIRLTLERRSYLAHRLAWLYVYGVWPKDEIDHINCDPSDNRIHNLREATAHQNKGNARKLRATKSGLKGVHWCNFKGCWASKIWWNGKRKHLGYFEEKEEAALAYAKAAKEVFGEFARSS
jgi:hypothetical protein